MQDPGHVLSDGPLPAMNALATLQFDLNRQTCGDWDCYAGHRARVTRLLADASPGTSGRLCVLGAGNCNDLDLAVLLQSYAEIHLVDLDATALTFGVARQALSKNPAVRLHGDIDLTGYLNTMAAWTEHNTIASRDVEICCTEPVRRNGLPSPFDVVASTCLLSQLCGIAVDTVGKAHARFLDLVRAIRIGHLRLLMHLVGPGGTGLLVTDVVSSDTAPALRSLSEPALAEAVARLIRVGNHFYGVAPAMLAAAFRDDPILAPQACALVYSHPWLWNLGPRVYAVYALKAEKARRSQV
jgi:hypothetical protein